MDMLSAFFRPVLYIILAVTFFFNSSFGFLKAKVVTVPENGSLVCVDELGRSVVSAGENNKKKVGMFYFLWLGEHGLGGPYDNTKITAEHPEAVFSEEAWAAAGGGNGGETHFWSEPLFGYYKCSDPWVLRKHFQMLSDAGVDFIVIDVTNTYIYEQSVYKMIGIWHEYLVQGYKVPQIAFYTNTDSGNTMNRVYDAFYDNIELSLKYYRLDDLWFKLDGKPMIIGNSSDSELRDDVKNYFRIKESQWPNFKKKYDGFPWMEFNRMLSFDAYYYAFGSDSIMNVSPAQHSDTICMSKSAWYGGNDHGRSWHDGAKDTSDNAVLYGYNFAEQWEYAINLDPDIIFVTGFNEWAAQRFYSGDPEKPLMFIDCCNEEYSRDVEPSAGILGDNYYMQLVNYIAKYKGVTAKTKSTNYVTAPEPEDFANNKITSVYTDYAGDIVDRDYDGFGSLHYSDTTGRNDFVKIKVCEDKNNYYFYAQTKDNIENLSDENSMTLLLSCADGTEFTVNRVNDDEGNSVIEAKTSEGYKSAGTAGMVCKENELVLTVSKSVIGSQKTINFKWIDNCDPSDVYSFYLHGDCAPYGRLNFVYNAK